MPTVVFFFEDEIDLLLNLANILPNYGNITVANQVMWNQIILIRSLIRFSFLVVWLVLALLGLYIKLMPHKTNATSAALFHMLWCFHCTTQILSTHSIPRQYPLLAWHCWVTSVDSVLHPPWCFNPCVCLCPSGLPVRPSTLCDCGWLWDCVCCGCCSPATTCRLTWTLPPNGWSRWRRRRVVLLLSTSKERHEAAEHLQSQEIWCLHTNGWGQLLYDFDLLVF